MSCLSIVNLAFRTIASHAWVSWNIYAERTPHFAGFNFELINQTTCGVWPCTASGASAHKPHPSYKSYLSTARLCCRCRPSRTHCSSQYSFQRTTRHAQPNALSASLHVGCDLLSRIRSSPWAAVNTPTPAAWVTFYAMRIVCLRTWFFPSPPFYPQQSRQWWMGWSEEGRGGRLVCCTIFYG